MSWRDGADSHAANANRQRFTQSRRFVTKRLRQDVQSSLWNADKLRQTTRKSEPEQAGIGAQIGGADMAEMAAVTAENGLERYPGTSRNPATVSCCINDTGHFMARLNAFVGQQFAVIEMQITAADSSRRYRESDPSRRSVREIAILHRNLTRALKDGCFHDFELSKRKHPTA